jgi:hypothetical protein
VRARATLAAAIFLLSAPAAWGAEATGAEVRALASRAGDDPAALEQLRAVNRVDGRSADLRAALAGAAGEDLDRRLAALVGAGPEVRVQISPPRDRAAAAAIVDGPPYEEAGPPRPFRRLVDRLDDLIQPLGRPAGWLADRIPGGWYTLAVLLSMLVVALSALVTARLGARRRGAVVERVRRAGRGEDADPERLEQLAAEAEQRGELDAALRLRFRAGLVRLARLRAVPQPEHLTSRQLIRALGSPRFAGLARDLDEVVYGGRRATAADLDAARRGWTEVLREVRRP